jgi:hypothetical protein
MMGEIALAVIGVVTGGIISIVITIVVESMRRPQLRLSTLDPFDFELLRSLRLTVKNEDLPRCARWMMRAPASQCHGKITFHHRDTGHDVFARQMQTRWASQPEPTPLILAMPDGIQLRIWDFARLSFGVHADIAPAEAEVLDVAVRFKNEDDCYGWNNETYSIADKHNPKWKLGRGQYLVRVTMVSSGLIFSEIFRLVNDVGQQDFRLEKATQEEKQRVENNL